VNPYERFCHNRKCRACGRQGEEHIVIHSKKERRYRYKRHSRTFSATKGTMLYRTHKPKELVSTVIPLLAHGCPLQAICTAFGLDERTVARWEKETRMHCRGVHEHAVEAGRVELGPEYMSQSRRRTRGQDCLARPRASSSQSLSGTPW
jgi:transposase-like protein